MSFLYVLQVGMWLNSEGEQMLKDSHTVDSLVCAEKALHHYDLFLTQAKVRPYFHFSPTSKIFTINSLFYCNWQVRIDVQKKVPHDILFFILGETAVRFKPGHRG